MTRAVAGRKTRNGGKGGRIKEAEMGSRRKRKRRKDCGRRQSGGGGIGERRMSDSKIPSVSEAPVEVEAAV